MVSAIPDSYFIEMVGFGGDLVDCFGVGFNKINAFARPLCVCCVGIDIHGCAVVKIADALQVGVTDIVVFLVVGGEAHSFCVEPINAVKCGDPELVFVAVNGSQIV